MQFWAIQTLNSLALGGLLFLLSSGFSLIFGLMRIANLTHGACFMLGAYVGARRSSRSSRTSGVAALLGGLAVAALGGLVERFVLRQLAGNELGQVLVTLGIAFIIADSCLSSGAATRSRCRRRRGCAADAHRRPRVPTYRLRRRRRSRSRAIAL